LSHNFGSRYARKSIKGSKDADHSLVPKKTLAKKIAYVVGAQGQVNLPKMRKYALIVTSPPKKRHTQTEKKFQSAVEDLLNL